VARGEPRPRPARRRATAGGVVGVGAQPGPLVARGDDRRGEGLAHPCNARLVAGAARRDACPGRRLDAGHGAVRRRGAVPLAVWRRCVGGRRGGAPRGSRPRRGAPREIHERPRASPRQSHVRARRYRQPRPTDRHVGYAHGAAPTGAPRRAAPPRPDRVRLGGVAAPCPLLPARRGRVPCGGARYPRRRVP
jgi:hypothetical protein